MARTVGAPTYNDQGTLTCAYYTLRGPVIDAADLVDDAGGVEEPLGEACLTGVYVRQDPEVQRLHSASCP